MEPYLTKNGYRIFRCGSCELRMTEFANHYEEFVRRFYQEGYFTGDPKYGAFTEYEKDKGNIIRNLSVILKHLKFYKPGGTLLDAGCAMGYMVEAALKAGYDAYGFDPSSYALSRADASVRKRLKGHTVKSAVYPKNRFDVVTLTDVFEHLHEPRADLVKLASLLKPGGLVVIATGNTDSLAARLFGWRWTFYIPPQHLYFYNKSNLTQVLEMSGLTPVHWFSVGKWLSFGYILHLAHVSSHVPGTDAVYRLAKRTGTDRIPLWVPLGDNIVVIARKIG